MYTTPNTDTMQGRQLAGLLQATNRRARMLLTVAIRKADGGTYQQTYRAKAWDGTNGRMLTLDLDDGDWAAGTYATKVLHVDTAAGTCRPARGMTDKALLYAAEAAVRWAFTGQAPQPGNGTVEVTAADQCGCCGAELRHPVSKELGIGPECAKRMGLEHHYKGTTLSSRARRQAAKDEAAAPAPVQPELPTTTVAAQAPHRFTAPGDMDPEMWAQSVREAEERRAADADAQVQTRMAHPASTLLAVPCRLCWGQSKLKGYTCGYCGSTGCAAAPYDLAGLDATTAAALRSLAAEAWRMAKQMALKMSEQDYVALADRLDTCMGELGGLYDEARSGLAVA